MNVLTRLDDLVVTTCELIDIPSESLFEKKLADVIEATLRHLCFLDVVRVDNSIVARSMHRARETERVIFAGHLDTVPANGNASSKIINNEIWGLGSSDMKSGLAVMLKLAAHSAQLEVPTTFVFYEAEEIASKYSGLLKIERWLPDLLDGQCAILGEPTSGVIEGGCQGNLNVSVIVSGRRAHSARPWKGVNAIHLAGELVAKIAELPSRKPMVDGCEFHESTQVVKIAGGIANNVVPDVVTMMINHRYAPDLTVSEAIDRLKDQLESCGATNLEITSSASGARPGLDSALLRKLQSRSDLEIRAKLGWTDAAFFASKGIPAINLGPGDPLLAHAPDERVAIDVLSQTYELIFEALSAR